MPLCRDFAANRRCERGLACPTRKANVWSSSVERPYELESLRRSLAMLRPGAPALDREEAMRLVRELQEFERQLRALRQGLQRLLADSEAAGPGPS